MFPDIFKYLYIYIYIYTYIYSTYMYIYIYTHHISIYIQIIHINMLEAGMCACRRDIPSEDLRATISLPRAHPGISSIKLKRAYAVITSFCMWSGDHLESLYRHRRPPRTFPPPTAPSQPRMEHKLLSYRVPLNAPPFLLIPLVG